jgi:hypothetical protein
MMFLLVIQTWLERLFKPFSKPFEPTVGIKPALNATIFVATVPFMNTSRALAISSASPFLAPVRTHRPA